MTKCLFSRRSLTLSGMLAVLITGVATGPALAKLAPPPAIDSSGCSSAQLSQPFLPLGDPNWYTLTPGETADNLDGGGWTLSSGAKITPTLLADGQTGSVLDLPSGAQAISPPVCVQSNYPTARTMVRTTSGSNLAIAVSYAGTKSASKPMPTGRIHGGDSWTASGPFNIHPQKPPGWQLVQFIFTQPAKGGDAQIYNFYVDPRMKA